MIDLIKKVAQNVAISLDYYNFLQLQASKSSPIDEKSPNLVTLDRTNLHQQKYPEPNVIKLSPSLIYEFL